MALLSLLDHLYCQEDNLELEDERLESVLPLADDRETERYVLLAAEAEDEEAWAEVLCALAAKEGEALGDLVPHGRGDDSYLPSARKAAAEWIARAAATYAFSALTAVLAVNYLDRCFLSCAAGGGLLRLRDGKPWMGRLAAMACLSLAAKMEETRDPFVLDLQVPATPEAAEEDEGEFVFESKTIRRMELLVLSALGWRMNPVTPLSFIHHVLPRLFSKAENADSPATAIAVRIQTVVRRCEAALLSVIADRRWVQYPASVWASAALLRATVPVDGDVAAVDSQGIHHLVALLNAPKEKVEECYQLLVESVRAGVVGHKRKHSSSASCYCSSPRSPSGVIGSCFSCGSPCDSWAAWPPSPPPSSPGAAPPFKRPSGNTTTKSFVVDGVETVSI
ncbi:cyclin-D3-2-like [Musa acuminata AAA Group]|uniref:cyclin-D3-2-like n=1 Tax=Musa acuminata AAA Group TaxID=214697 RepID=UPI0031DB6A22